VNISTRVGLVAVGCVFLASVSYAADLAIPAKRDNTLYQGQADGGPPDGERSNALGPNIWTGKGSNGNLKRSALFFDCKSIIPAEATITSAVLVLTLDRAQPNVGPTDIGIYRLVADWGEGTSDASLIDGGGRGTNATPGDMTFTHNFFNSSLWVTAGGEYVATPSASATARWPQFSDGPPFQPTNHLTSIGVLEIDIQNWIDGVNPEYGWMLRGDETQQPTAKRYWGVQHTIASQRPILLVGFNTLTTTTSTTTLPIRFEDTAGTLVGYWPGDDTTADDLSEFNNDGTFAGDAGPTTNIPNCLFANQTNSFAFDGAGDWITIGNAGVPGGPDPNISIAFWVNVQSRPDNPGDEEFFFSLGHTAGNNRRLMIGGRNEGDVTIEHGGLPDWLATSTFLPLNTWVHVAYTASNGTDRIYTNGILSDVNAAEFQLVNVGNSRIGSAINNNPAGDLEMDGYIDEPAIFNRTLTSAEIAKLHFGTTTSTTSTSSTITSSTSTISTSTATSTTTTSTTTSPFVNPIPYGEPFEAMPPYTNDFEIDGINGWIGKNHSAVISTNAALNAAIEVGLAIDNVPVGIPGPHTKVLCVTPDNVPISRPREAMKIASKVNGNTSTLFSDFLWQPRLGAEPRTVGTNAQLALYPHYNGKIIIYHDDSGTAEWHPLTNSPVLSTSTWVRVTVEQNFTESRWRLRINGQEHITDPKGWTTAGGSTPNGSWFDMVSKGPSLSKIEFEGEGYTDDVIVQTQNPFQDALLLIIR
jgi:hypothetical protein